MLSVFLLYVVLLSVILLDVVLPSVILLDVALLVDSHQNDGIRCNNFVLNETQQNKTWYCNTKHSGINGTNSRTYFTLILSVVMLISAILLNVRKPFQDGATTLSITIFSINTLSILSISITIR
jgi:hypothetical protein